MCLELLGALSFNTAHGRKGFKQPKVGEDSFKRTSGLSLQEPPQGPKEALNPSRPVVYQCFLSVTAKAQRRGGRVRKSTPGYATARGEVQGLSAWS